VLLIDRVWLSDRGSPLIMTVIGWCARTNNYILLLIMTLWWSCCVVAGGDAPLLLLLFNGDPVDVTFAHESPRVDAIMSCVYPAQATGDALYRIVTMTGPHSVPAARLPNTWPAVLHQVATAVGFPINYHAGFLLVLYYLVWKQSAECEVMSECITEWRCSCLHSSFVHRLLFDSVVSLRCIANAEFPGFFMVVHFPLIFCLFLSCIEMVRYGDGAGNTVEENSSVFSLIRMR